MVEPMPKRSSKVGSLNVMAATRVREGGTEELMLDRVDGKNPAAVALGRLGGKKGGKARAEKLSAEERSAISRAAAHARWSKREKQS